MILVFATIFLGTLSAQDGVEETKEYMGPSVFDIGIVLNYSYADLHDQNFSAYVPALQFQWNVLPWLGVSATGYSRGQNFAALIVEAVLRAPLGLLEPYIATGPGYLIAFTDDLAVSGTSNFAYSIRAGLDFNITNWFSVGPGLSLLVPDVRNFFDTIETVDVQYLKENSLIGINAKFRF